jgi:uncharacterized protein (DUF433 family)
VVDAQHQKRQSKRTDRADMKEVFAFSAEQVRRLTGLTQRQLRYWDDTDFFSPALRDETRYAPFARVYSYGDVVSLRAIAELRKAFKVPLQHLRKVGLYLSQHYDEPWARLTFYVVGKTVYFQDERSAAIANAAGTGQEVMEFALERVEGDLSRAIERARTRDADWIGQIIKQRYVAQNRPVLAGTRVPTEAIWEFHLADYPTDAILREYPQLQAADVEAAIAFERGRQKKVA